MEIIRSAVRRLRAHPLFTAAIIVLLGLGIGASTAIFSVVRAVLLKPLPYPEPGQLVLVRKPPRDPAANLPGGGDMTPDNEFLAWTEAAPKSFRGLAGYRNGAATLQLGDGAMRVPAASVTGQFFPLLGVSAWRGRLFTDAELRPGAPPTVILSHAAWQARFNGDDAVVGRVVKIDDVPHTVIGVLPPAFSFIEPAEFWKPLAVTPSAPGQLRITLIRVFGRVPPSTSLASATRELDDISARFWSDLIGGLGDPFGPRPAGASAPRLPFADNPAQLVPLHEQLVRQSRATLWLLLVAVGLVLLIACANIANLQLARAFGRQREFAVRAALGASPLHLAATLLAENLLLAFGGGALALVLAWWSTRALQAWLAGYLPHLNAIEVDPAVLGFALLAAVLAGLGFGLAPAWAGSRIDLLATLKDGSGGTAGGRRGRRALVALEVALALVLAINTGLLVRGIYRLYATELGFRTADVLTANLALPRRYGTPVQQREFATRWLDALAALPGVKAAALTDMPPLSPYQQIVMVGVRGGGARGDASSSAQPPSMAVATVSPEFFRTTGIALRQGRVFGPQDGPDAPAVALVNETFVKQYYPGGLTLGTEITLPDGGGTHGAPPPTAAVVGIVADIRPRGFESSAQPMAYFPLAQQPRTRLSAVLQFDGDAAVLGRAVTASAHQLDADLALDQPSTLEEQITRQTAPRRVTLGLTATFAGTAVLLAALGIFGVMSVTVAQRTREISVRLALGADPGAIFRWMLGEAGLTIGAGLGVGLALTFASNRLLVALLTGNSAPDAIAVGAGLGVLGAVGLVACLGPAWRATRVNPADSLRAE